MENAQNAAHEKKMTEDDYLTKYLYKILNMNLRCRLIIILEKYISVTFININKFIVYKKDFLCIVCLLRH